MWASFNLPEGIAKTHASILSPTPVHPIIDICLSIEPSHHRLLSLRRASHRHPSIRLVFVFGVVPRCRPCCCACSSPSHGGHCAAVSLVLLVLFRFIFALRRRKMPPQLANRRTSLAELVVNVRAWASLTMVLLCCAVGSVCTPV